MPPSLHTDDVAEAQRLLARLPRADRVAAVAEMFMHAQPRDIVIAVATEGLPKWRRAVKRSHALEQSFFTANLGPEDIDAIWRYIRAETATWEPAFAPEALPRG